MKIIIAGSSSGIGKAAAEKLLSERHSVIGLARQHDKFQPANANYFPISVDFSDTEHLEARFKTLLKTHEDSEAIICSVGYGKFVELEQFSFEQMQHIMQVNFLSQALLIKLFLPGLKKKKLGKIKKPFLCHDKSDLLLRQ